MKKFPLPDTGLPMLILEAGVNHEGNIKSAENMIREASGTQANFIKFQTYTASKISSKISPAYWNLNEESINSQFELFSKYDNFSLEDYELLAKVAEQSKIGFLTTCFDTDWLNKLIGYMPFIKIASADLTNHILLRAAASKQKPILLSTGAASMDEVAEAVKIIKSISDSQICLMHCVLNYPTEFNLASLSRITQLKLRFPDLLIGYSDHTRPRFSHAAIQLATALGAVIIEKHFTLDKSLKGNDHYHSFDVADVALLYHNLRTQNDMLAFNESAFLEAQIAARTFARRGIYASASISEGEEITIDKLIPLRPTWTDGGYLGSEVELILGRRAVRDIEEGEPITRKNTI